jgi:hypothetical protein
MRRRMATAEAALEQAGTALDRVRRGTRGVPVVLRPAGPSRAR